MMKTIHYRGARIELTNHGAGWSAKVFLSGSWSAHTFAPAATGPDAESEVTQRAKQLVHETERTDEIP